MQAGRELDKLIGEKIFGWKRIAVPEYWVRDFGASPTDTEVYPPDSKEEHRLIHDAPHYSTFIADAWQVIETLIPLEGWKYGIRLEHCTESSEEHWLCAIHTITACPPYEDMDPNHITVQAKTAPLAICLAALKVVGVEVEEPIENE